VLTEFGSRASEVRRGKAGSAERDSQDDAALASEKDMSHLLRRARHSLDEHPFSKQRLPWIGHLRPLIASTIRVVEVGIKKWCRSTKFNMTS
jgi:hypothetical protein